MWKYFWIYFGIIMTVYNFIMISCVRMNNGFIGVY